MASLQSETAYAVVELLVGECVHKAVGTLKPEVVACLALKVGLAIHGERLQVATVRHNDAATVVHLQLAVLSVDSLFATYEYVLGQQTFGL